MSRLNHKYSKELCILYTRYLISSFSGWKPVKNDITILNNLLTKMDEIEIDSVVVILSIEHNNILSACTFYGYGLDIISKTLDDFKQEERHIKLNKLNENICNN